MPVPFLHAFVINTLTLSFQEMIVMGKSRRHLKHRLRTVQKRKIRYSKKRERQSAVRQLEKLPSEPVSPGLESIVSYSESGVFSQTWQNPSTCPWPGCSPCNHP